MINGGARPGAGRKKGGKNKKTIEKDLAKEYLVNRYLQKWDELASTALNLALGEYQVLDANGKTMKVYKASPDPRTLQGVLETVIGKATQPLSGDISFPQLIQLSNDIREILNKK